MNNPLTTAAWLLALAFYGAAFLLLLMGACHFWLDLQERLEGRRAKRRSPRHDSPDWRRSFNHENTDAPSGPPPLRLRRPTRDDRLDAADVVRYLRCRDQQRDAAMTDPTDAQLLATVDAVTVTLPPMPMDQTDAHGRIAYDMAWRIAMARAVLERWGRPALPLLTTEPTP